jgi:hypothetical protein
MSQIGDSPAPRTENCVNDGWFVGLAQLVGSAPTGGQPQGQPSDQDGLGVVAFQNLFTVEIPEDLANVSTVGELP